MKQIKDPVYGYIDIDDSYIPLIDTAEFQRLRNIRLCTPPHYIIDLYTLLAFFTWVKRRLIAFKKM